MKHITRNALLSLWACLLFVDCSKKEEAEVLDDYSGAVAVIKSLFENHNPWNESEKDDIDWSDSVKSSRYLDSALVRLLLDDFKCMQITRGECALFSDPIYYSQDYYADSGFEVNLHMVSENPDLIYDVTLNNYQEINKFKYWMKKEGTIWKISDIGYPDNSSLKDRLSSVPDFIMLGTMSDSALEEFRKK